MNENGNNIEQTIEEGEETNLLLNLDNVPDPLQNSYLNNVEKNNQKATNEAIKSVHKTRLSFSLTYGEPTDFSENTFRESFNSPIIDYSTELVITEDTLANINDKIIENEEQLRHLQETLSVDEYNNSEEVALLEIHNSSMSRTLDTHEVLPDEQASIVRAIGNLNTMESAQQANPELDHSFEDYDPINFLAQEYENKSESEKIELIRYVGRFMSSHYDEELRDGSKLDDTLTSEDMWTSLAAGEAAGICGNIHKELARLGEEMGMDSEIVTVNSEGAHIVMRGRKEDGKFFLIDYGVYYESESQDELMDKYMLHHNSLQTVSFSGRSDGSVKGIHQTALQKEIGDIMYVDPSDEVPEGGLNVQTNNTNEIKLAYTRMFDKHYVRAFGERNEHYGIAHNYYGIQMGNTNNWGLQFSHAQNQESQGYSGFYTKNIKFSEGLQAHIGTAAKLGVNGEGEAVDGKVDMYGGVKKGAFSYDIYSSIVPKDLSGDWDDITIVPTHTLGYKNSIGKTNFEVTAGKSSYHTEFGIKAYGDNGAFFTNIRNEEGLGGTQLRARVEASLKLTENSEVNSSYQHSESNPQFAIGYKRTF